MRLLTPSVAAVAAFGFATSTMAFATPSPEMLGLRARDSTQYARPNPCSLADSPSVNASVQLSSWMECQINGFFPYPANKGWDKVFARTFSPDLLATFNDTRYNYDGWLAAYHSFNKTLAGFKPFRHGFINTLGIPNANGDKGGFVYVIGWEGGYHSLLKKDLYFTDATFAVVKEIEGKRKVVEFRESSNIPNTAPMPEENLWTCGFT